MSAVGRGIVLRQIDRLFGEGTLTGLGDGQLLERYLTRRDEDAFEAIVDQHGPMVLGLCRRMLRDPRDIEDAFQATFLVLVRKAPAIRDRALLSSWLYGVAYRVARRARTRTLRRRDRESTVGELEVAAEPEPSGRSEFDPMLDQELGRLPEKYRGPLVLCYLRGRTHDQAAEELRCPVGTVRSRLARGRELLRKRLVRRGYAPTVPAALLGGDTTLPARLLLATVPPPLGAATVRAALGFGSSSIFKAGAVAASSVVLAQGVLTTMKLAQLRWIELAILATGLSAGGVVAAGYTAIRTQEEATSQDRAVASSVDEPKSGRRVTLRQTTEERLRVLEEKIDRLASGQRVAPRQTTEERLKVLEDKIDRLVSRIDVPSAPRASSRSEPIPDPGVVARPDDSGPRNESIRSERAPSPMGNPISELETRLKTAIRDYDRVDALYQRGAISISEREQAAASVLIIAAQMEGLDNEYQDEMDRLTLERRRKAAQYERAKAQEEIAASVAARNNRLVQRKMVGPDDVAKGEGELKIAAADSKIAEVQIREVELRIRQLERRHDRIQQVATLAERVKKDALPLSKPGRPDAASVPPRP
jgi:RNA polymerase sigma factor (sigma-70 family)